MDLAKIVLTKFLYLISYLFFSAACLQCNGDKPDAASEEAGAVDVVKDIHYFYQQATTAYEAKNYAAFLESMEAALALRPGTPNILYNIAAGNALNGNAEKALVYLQKIAEMGLVYPTGEDEDFKSLRNNVDFQQILQQFAENQKPVGESKKAFRIEQKGLIPESIAYDPVGEVFYISSVWQRKILQSIAGERILNFSKAGDGLLGVFGLKVDAPRRKLWACIGAVPEMAGFSEEMTGKTGIAKYDLEDYKLEKIYFFPDTTDKHLFGDLLLQKNGNVYLSDSFSPNLYVLRNDSSMIESFATFPGWISPQGLAFSDDEKTLFVADYPTGIYRLDMITGEIVSLAYPENQTLIGVDGLYFYQNSLIAIQNGISPHRIVRLALNTAQDRVEKLTVLEANNPIFDEPTLGTIVGNQFYYIANSQWSTTLDKAGNLRPENELAFPVIMRMKLF